MRKSTHDTQIDLMRDEKKAFQRRASNQSETIKKGCYREVNKHLPNPGCYRSKEK